MTNTSVELSVELFNGQDYQGFYQLIENNRARLLDFFAGTCNKTQDLKSTEQYCHEINQKLAAKSYFPFLIKHLRTGQYIGLIDLKNLDWTNKESEVGYFVDAGHEGSGIMKWGLAQVVSWCKKNTDLERLFCRIHESNQKSKALAVNSGFNFDCVLKANYTKSNGETVDLTKFTLLLRN